MSDQAFSNQLNLLERRLVADPRAFRELFTADGMESVAWEFRQSELSSDFINRVWEVLSRDDDASQVLLRFLWRLPVGKKRMFIRALDVHLLAQRDRPSARRLQVRGHWPPRSARELER